MNRVYRGMVWFAAAGLAFVGLWFVLPHPTRAQSPTGSPQWVEFQLSPLGQNGTDVSDTFVVWSDYAGWPYDPFPLSDTCLNDYPETNHFSAPDGRAAICLYDLTTGMVMSVTNAAATNYLPRTDGTWIVFRRHASPADLVALNSFTGEEQTILDRNSFGIFLLESPHQVDQGYVVATGLLPLSTDRAVVVHDIAHQQTMILTQSSVSQPGHADISYPFVVWHEMDGTSGMDIMGYNLTTQTAFTISTQLSHEVTPRIDDTTVVWETEGDVVGYDLAGGTSFTITQDAYQQKEPAISERWIVWQDDRYGQWEIVAYDRFDGQIYRVTNHPAQDQHPAVAGDVITWERTGNNADGVYAARLMTYFMFLPWLARP